MSARIEARGLTKRYGSFEAIHDLSLRVEPGSVFGLLGQNGAGKTTTFKCLLGFARPTAGEVRYDGEPLVPECFERLAYVPETSALYDWMTVREHLELTRRSFRRFEPARAQELLALFELDDRKAVKHLSKGQRTAVALVLAFSMRPEILILDEPASGLDPIHQRHTLDLMIDAAAAGATILFSSHQITQVERAADRVGIMRHGRLVLTDDVDTLKANRKIVEAIFPEPLVDRTLLADDVHVARTETVGKTVRLFVHRDAPDVARRAYAAGATSARILDQNLEDIFFDAAAGDGATEKS